MNTHKHIPLLITVLLVGWLAACGDQMPQQELDDAQAALARADSAEADMYAADLYEAARDSLAAGQAEVEAGAYDRARELFLAAATLANEAVSEAVRQKGQLEILPDSLGAPDSLSNGLGK